MSSSSTDAASVKQMTSLPAAPTRLLFLVDSLVGGGTQQALYDYLRCTDSRKIRIRVIALSSVDEVFADRMRRYAELEFVHAGRNNPLILLNPFLWRRICNQIASFDPHILHTRLDGSLIYGSILSRFLKIPKLIHTIEASERQSTCRLAQVLFYRTFLRRADAILTGYPDEYRSMKLPGEKMRLCEAAVDLDDSAPRPDVIESEEDFCGSRPILVSVGRLHPDKGHQHAIRLMSAIRTSLPTARLYICGEGDYRAELERMIQREKLVDRVRLLGYVPRVDWLLERADIFLGFMVNEPLNLAAARAMKWGLPVLAFKTGLCTHVRIQEGVNGFELPMFDLESAPEKLVHLLKTADRQIVRNSTVLLGAKELAEKYDHFYTALCDQGINHA